ncbi:MAG: dTDP-glucose 4,6-dehydratase [Bdellovibrionales bacterium]
MKFLVTGGAGFIGSHFAELLLKQGHQVVVVDALTYAGDRRNLAHLPEKSCTFIQHDICDAEGLRGVFAHHEFNGIFNFAAETHVDRSISGPQEFVRTNLVGTSVLVNESLKHWEARGRPEEFRYVQISTDEVFGALENDTDCFSEETPYAPNSPYSASKAGADHLVRAWHKTYGLPTLITHCSNNYGSRQYPEKLIPALIRRALAGEGLGVYGDGQNVRDWLHVSDHCRGIWLAYAKGRIGEHYCFGGGCELKNLELVHQLCEVLDEVRPRASGGSYRELISFVPDRPGHDRRYAIDCSKARRDLGYEPRVEFTRGFRDTILWYLNKENA